MSSEYGSIGNLSPVRNNASKNNKRNAIIAIFSVLSVMLVIAVSDVIPKNNGRHSHSFHPYKFHATSKAIISVCKNTDYKHQCHSSLTKAAGHATDPKKLIESAFDSSINVLLKVVDHTKDQCDISKDPRTQKALHACSELVNYAIDELKNSFNYFGSIDISKIDDIVDDLKVWLSAAVTYQETCLDGFLGTTGDAGELMRQVMKASQVLTSNCLAMLEDISSILASFKFPFFRRGLLSHNNRERKMMAGEYPEWVSNGRRKLLALSTQDIKPNVIVAQDGSGKFRTINEALPLIPKNGETPFVVYIKEGVYTENVRINRSMINVVFIGDGPTKTKITGNLNFIDGTPTFQTATVAVVGDGFIAKNIGFENSAGAEKHQAVALRVQSDKSVFYNCRMDGYQDTLYAHTKRQFYRNCTITGTIDFVFGDSPTVLQNCLLLARKPLANQQNIVTAQGRKDRREPTGFILHNCTISADPSLQSVQGQTRTYLGRPWKEYSRTIIVQSQIDDVIHPDGWLPWAGDFGLKTCFYAEVANRGPGAVTDKRVTWKGIKQINLTHVQEKLTVEKFIQGNQWLKATGVPYIPGLLPGS